jgi:hypothetical protein
MVLTSQLPDLFKTLEIPKLDFALGNLSAVGIAIQSFYLIVVTVIAILVLILIIAVIDKSINRRITNYPLITLLRLLLLPAKINLIFLYQKFMF